MAASARPNVNPLAASTNPVPMPVTFPALRTLVSPYRRPRFCHPWVNATCMSAVAFNGNVTNLTIPSGGFMGSFAKDFPKSIPDPIAAANEPVIGSHYHQP